MIVTGKVEGEKRGRKNLFFYHAKKSKRKLIKPSFFFFFPSFLYFFCTSFSRFFLSPLSSLFFQSSLFLLFLYYIFPTVIILDWKLVKKLYSCVKSLLCFFSLSLCSSSDFLDSFSYGNNNPNEEVTSDEWDEGRKESNMKLWKTLKWASIMRSMIEEVQFFLMKIMIPNFSLRKKNFHSFW